MSEENKMIFKDLRDEIIIIRNQKVMLDSSVAKLYGVETKRINEAVKNNVDKFPPDYMFRLNEEETKLLRSKNLTLNEQEIQRSKISTANLAKSRYAPAVFTEKGLYMLATILKSKTATQATFAIIETFAKVRELKNELKNLHSNKNPNEQESKLNHFGEMLSDIIMPDLETQETESTLELNFFIGKIKHSVKRIKRQNNDKS